jgi:uncharacterized protein YktB (UPF0637 family)
MTTSNNKSMLKSDNKTCNDHHRSEEIAYSEKERQELGQLARKLRRVKRKMFLKQLEQPKTPVDLLRELLMRKIVDDQ